MEVLKKELDQKIDAVRAKTKIRVPVVMTVDEVKRIIRMMEGLPQLLVKILYGCGLRITEGIRLRVHDIDFDHKSVTVRSGKGDKDRVTTFPASVIPSIKAHLVKVKEIHDRDLADGYGAVYLPHALSRKYKNADIEWGWQYVFPSKKLSNDPGSNILRRHHIDPSSINKAIKTRPEKPG